MAGEDVAAGCVPAPKAHFTVQSVLPSIKTTLLAIHPTNLEDHSCAYT